MQDKPWWIYACEFVIWAGSIAFFMMLLAYVAGTDGPPLLLGSDAFWIVCVSILALVGLITSVVIIRRLRRESGGWLGVVDDIFWWW